MDTARYRFVRASLPMSVVSMPSGGARLRFDLLGDPAEVRLTADTLQAWAAGPAGEIPRSFYAGPIRRVIRRWLDNNPLSGEGVQRIELEIDEPALMGLPWEQGFLAAGLATCVRVSPTPPMAGDLALSFPLRFLQVKRKRSRVDLEAEMGSASWYGPAVLAGRCPLSRVSQFRRQAKWPTADVIHFAAPVPPEPILLSTARVGQALSLGWLARLAGTWQTRLVVLECESVEDRLRALRLGRALADRGGPAVLVAGPGPARELRQTLLNVYYGILHDRPLDAVWTDHKDPARYLTLIGGLGREDQLRVSNILLDVFQLGVRLASLPPQRRRPENWAWVMGDSTLEDTHLHLPHWSAHRASRRIVQRGTKGMPGPRTGRRILNQRILSKADSWEFEFRETDGAGPTARAIEQVRADLALSPVVRPASYGNEVLEERFGGGVVVLPESPQPSPEERLKFVNPLLAERLADGSQRVRGQRGPALTLGSTYYLYIDIGPENSRVTVLGATPLQEAELFAEGADGAWVEIGVTGLDFEVIGPGVREFWVPKGNESSQAVVFPVIPRRAGTARLRYSVYVDQNLIQSYLLAARISGPEEKPGTARDLARALGTPRRKVGRAAWLSRLEYSRSKRLTGSGRRALSIVSNHDGDKATITVKGADAFGVRTSADLPALTDAIRRTLGDICRPDNPLVVDKRQLDYGFGADNSGSRETLIQHLVALAELGSELYDKVIPGPAREAIEGALKEDDRSIHVANILVDEVIPWSVVYDRPFDTKREDDMGNPVAPTACLAALPKPDGTLSRARCGQAEDCILNQACMAERGAGAPPVFPETVVCPRHFWGFRHFIELPRQQTESVQAAREEPRRVENAAPARMAFGAHGGLSFVGRHLKALKSGEMTARVRIGEPVYRRQAVIELLKASDLDIIYLYCHAEGGKGTGIRVPVLKFQGPEDDREGVIEAKVLHGPAWEHHPLVIVNGCGTGAFQPDALSPFIRKMIEDRGGGAFIGTEITVFEALALYGATELSLSRTIKNRPPG
jgi:hypothetical protein